MRAATLGDLLEEVKYAKSRGEVDALAKRYDIDVEKIRSLTRFVNTPTIEPESVKRTVTKDGEVVVMEVRLLHPICASKALTSIPQVSWKDAPALR